MTTPKKPRKRTPDSYARPLERTLKDMRAVHSWLMSRWRANRRNQGPDDSVAEVYDEHLNEQLNRTSASIAKLGSELRAFERGLRMSELTDDDVVALIEKSWGQVARHVSNVDLLTEAHRRGFVSKDQLRETVERELAEARRTQGHQVPSTSTGRGTEVS